MNGPPTDNRPASSEQHQDRQEEDDDLDDTASLLLQRTRSPEINVAESIAVQEIPPEPPKPVSDEDDTDPAATSWPRSARYLVLLCSFLTSFSFAVTQVPLIYVFRLMTCDAYYNDRSPQVSNETTKPLSARMGSLLFSDTLASMFYSRPTTVQDDYDRCSIHAIESSTALSIALLAASTMVFGILNLFIAGSWIKRIGVKSTLLINVFFPAVRLFVQNVGLEVWGKAGINIIQCSQIVSILGGPSGYLLVLNAFMTEVVDFEGRTAALGRLAGSMMGGSAIGFLLGGILGEAFGIKVPFRLTFVLFLSSCAYAAVFLPYIPPAKAKTVDSTSASYNKKSGVSKFIGPLAVFAPRKFIRRDGVVQTEYGTFLLACGVFLAILATGYLITLLQLYSTDVFGFGTNQNGWLIFVYSLLRGVFLTFAFPRLIALGRKLTAKTEEHASGATDTEEAGASEQEPLLGAKTYQASTTEVDKDKDKDKDTKPEKERTYTFDLTYTRFSLLADGLLTLLCALVRRGWQMYLVATVLPFAAGTGSASKGTILQMIGSSAGSSERTDALAGISLVENIARLSTTFLFGVIFAGFASIGRTELVFTCNAAVALIGFGVLLFARFPPEGSRRLDLEDESTPTPAS